MTGHLTTAIRAGTFITVALSLSVSVATAESAHAWVEPSLLAAAKKEGSVVVYSSTNEGEGLPLFKLFENATGIKVQYVRAADSVLTSRMAIEARANQPSFDIAHMTSINKLPPRLLAQFVPPEAKNIPANAQDPGHRWYGVYANYNTAAYNTKLVKPSEVPKSYEEFAERKQWKGKVAIDGTDSEWLWALVKYFGEQKGMQLAKRLVANLDPVVTAGHLAMARSVGAGEYVAALNNYTNLNSNVKFKGGAIENLVLDPVPLFFGQVAVNAKAPHPNAARLAENFMLSQECQQFYTKFGRLPTRNDVQSNPPGLLDEIKRHKIVTILMTPADEKKWGRAFNQVFKHR